MIFRIALSSTEMSVCLVKMDGFKANRMVSNQKMMVSNTKGMVSNIEEQFLTYNETP